MEDKLKIRINDNYADVANSNFGLYGYFDEKGTCLYVGVDSDIKHNHRHNYHLAPSKRTEQQWNRYLQSKAAKRITYSVLAVGRDKEEMENMEIMYIMFFKALGQCKFNRAVSIDVSIAEAIANNLLKTYKN